MRILKCSTHVTVLAICVVLLRGGSAGADLIVNGSFETATVNPGGGFVSLSAGSTAIDGWTVGLQGIDYIGGYWQASDGSRSLDLSLLNAGEIIAQDFATDIGEEYMVTFDMAGNPDGPPIVKELRVSAAGDFADFTFDTTGHSHGSMGWEENSWTFTAVDTTTTLAFISTTYTAYGPALDNVSVTLIPAPGAVLLGVIGLGLVGWVRKRYG